MSLSQMQVFNKYFMPATIETLAQMVDKFNAASGGTIRLTTEGFEGDFLQESFYAAIHSARRRVDRYAANADQAATDLTQQKHTSVKVAGGFGPVRYEPSQMTWLEKPTAEGIEVASRNFAEALLQDQLNTAIAALVAAISNQGADTTVDVSATGPVTYAAVNNSHALFGDHSGLLVAQVMDGATYHGFIGQNIANAQQLFQAGTVRVIDILGKISVITDAPALFTAAAGEDPAMRRVLSLVAGAATVTDSRDIISNIQTTNGKQRIETTLQIDYTFGLGLKGYTWDETNGGKSPTDAELATGSNWDKVATSIKHTAGTLAIGAAQ
ncbi:major capsid protein [Brucella anthropi]|uniref:major capsid protein n=1 Tax=Brucella anthropi TaxID=529 RepID=UPI00241C4946|nr:major capsid protein [Brucella anthropi]MDG9793060.1 major capsid protein [Brucella anthropi]MDH0580218.1 major capsid protein [Brucella anthropi]MDH0816842.1 major capsid protein [Brucella anthropi]MDH2083374.1 major capsid protein [Brucella anthropi]